MQTDVSKLPNASQPASVLIPTSGSSEPVEPNRKPKWTVQPGPIAVWVGIQTIPLLLTAGQVRFASVEGFPNPPEQLTTPLMVAFQLIGSSLLFPYLMKTRGSGAAVVITAVPFTILANFLGCQFDVLSIEMAVGYVAAWLISLCLLHDKVDFAPVKWGLVAAITAWVTGGGLLQYLHAEYGAQTLISQGSSYSLTPLVEAINNTGDQPKRGWALLGFAIISMLMWGTLTLKKHRTHHR